MTPPTRMGPALLLLFFACISWSLAGAAAPVYDTAEVVLHSAQTFDGNSGTPNPFTSVTLTLTVVAPDGRTFQVDGFFDGNGAGGAVGDVFKARIFLDQPGTWSWTSSSATSGLDGRSGQIPCSGTLPGLFAKGPVVVPAATPRYFGHADGTPVLLLGKMLDFDAPPAQFTTFTFFSETFSESERRAELDYQHSLRVNTMAIYLFNQNDFNDDGPRPTNPWVGGDRTRFDLAHWRTFETWTRTLRDEGMVAQLWFFADDSGVGGFSMADRLRLIRYGMARLSAYANTMFVTTLEWEEAFTASEVDQAGQYLQSFNPWRRLTSVHGLPGLFDFPNASWANYMDLQIGILDDWDGNHQDALENRALAAKPSFCQEFAQGYESGFSRIKAWSVFFAGQAGVGSGAYLAWLAEFARTVPFQRMAPADSRVVSGDAYCMAESGVQYVVYFPLGGTALVDLSGASGTLDAQWFDPRTGQWSSAGTVSGGGTVSFTSPQGDDDMALWLRPPSGSAPPPVLGVAFTGRTGFDWSDTRDATSYDVVRGDLAVLRAQRTFTPAVNACLENNGTDRHAEDPVTPASGQGFWYLVRGVSASAGPGSYSIGDAGERPGRDPEIGASSAACP
ncbi:MAG TPA: DUF5060 domain-containing protein [Candidatus Polarisedimenticolaceae bacterium]|nr:DUF5060 domain-containing protein [Candidatus Polarisedimenticolaceae bacterium]